MKKIVMIFAALVLMASTVSAQSNDRQNMPDRTEMVKIRTDNMVKAYGLDEAQAAKLLQLNTAYAGKLPRIGRRGTGRRGQPQQEQPTREQMEARMKTMRANMEAYHVELKKIMTEEQYKRYEAVQRQRMQRRGQDRHRQNNVGSSHVGN